MNATQKSIDNEITKIDIELATYLSKEDIPFKILKLTSGDVFSIETTICSEEQKDNIFEIERKKTPYLEKKFPFIKSK